jgi:hypothetical protein
VFRGPGPTRTDPSKLKRPRVSIICTGRNDDRAPDQFERLISVQRTLEHALRNVGFEFLFIEWNPDPERRYLGDALYLEQARHFVVTRDAHKALIANANLSTRDGKAVKGELAFLLNHANNVGLKHAHGEWVLITNLDDLFPPQIGELFEKGESRALAVGIHPKWSYNLLIQYRRAQRTIVWRLLRRAKRALAKIGRACKSVLRSAIGQVRSGEPGRVNILPFDQADGLLSDPGAQTVVLPPARVADTPRKSVRRKLFLGPLVTRQRERTITRAINDFLFEPRIKWNVGRVKLRPGTLYRVRRHEVRRTFACRAAQTDSIEQLVAELEADARPGPWSNDFPWNWASGDFMLLDYATWKRIGGFPQQIGQLHADSITIFRLVAEGCRIALLDWNIYHVDHDDRFDAVPYVEYDFENVRRYFSAGWTKAEAMNIERTDRRAFGGAAGSDSSLVGMNQPDRMREES